MLHTVTKSLKQSVQPACIVFCALVLLMMGTSINAQAQEAQARAEYLQLEEAATLAKEMYSANPTAQNRAIVERALEAYERFERDNRAALQGRSLGEGSGMKTQATGGPDAFGYRFIDSAEPGGPTFNFSSISGLGTLCTDPGGCGDDDGGETAPLNFTFSFYGVDYNSMPVASNGYLNPTGNDVSDFTENCPIVAAGGGDPDGVIAPLWLDFNPSNDVGSGDVWYGNFASCPTGSYDPGGECFVAEWTEVAEFSASDANTFQAILYPDGVIEYQYETIDTSDGDNEGTAGIENHLGNDGLTYGCPGNGVGVPVSGTAVLFTPPNDLRVVKTSSNTNPQLGDMMDFIITVSNIGPSDFTGIEVTDVLPAELTFVSSTATQGAYDDGTGIWTVGSLNDGQSATLTITAEVTDTSANVVSNTATITASNENDFNPANDSSTVTFFIQSADLSIDKSASDASPDLGTTFDYDLEVCHEEGIPAIGVRVTDRLPAGVSFVSANGADYDPVSGILQAGDFEEGDCKIFTLTVRMETTEEVTNRADISFSSAPDPFLGNNDDEVTVNGEAADLELDKRVAEFFEDNGVFHATFEVTVTNQGPSSASSIDVSDMVSTEAVIHSVSVSQGTSATFPGNFVEWDLGTLLAGESATLTM
ncbi:MAG TPA: DUF11 domain-containing protein, partial [Rhodothermales bacterium]|nr:DUF11 domain-containing protein [Rhodothermales bacterium]